MDDFNIIPECFIDTTLIETIVPPLRKGGYNHQHSCNSVAKIMKEKLNDQFAIGIIDNDKHLVSYAQECKEIVSTESFSLRKHLEKPHYFIFVNPAMDGFILKCAKEENINMEELGLSGELDLFLKRTKTKKTKKDADLITLIKGIKKAAEIRILRDWLIYMKKNKYEINPEELVSIKERIVDKY